MSPTYKSVVFRMLLLFSSIIFITACLGSCPTTEDDISERKEFILKINNDRWVVISFLLRILNFHYLVTYGTA